MTSIELAQMRITADDVAGATVDADLAAHAAGVEIKPLKAVAELNAARQLFSNVWDFKAEGGKVPLDLLRALEHAGAYVGGAYRDGELVGASLAFPRMNNGRPSLHSHITGVLPDVAGTGVGRALKLHQRQWALGHGIGEVVWTFDPLVRRNAYFNLVKLRSTIVAYYQNFYGEMPDGLNFHDESDRCLTSWRLLDDRVSEALRNATPRATVDGDHTAIVLLDADGAVTAVEEALGYERALVWVPPDIVSIRKTDPRAGSAWRLALRQSLGRAIEAGWHVNGIRSDGWYELSSPSLNGNGNGNG